MTTNERLELEHLACHMGAMAQRLRAAARLLDAAEKARALIDQVRALTPATPATPAVSVTEQRRPIAPPRTAAVASALPATRATPARSSRAFAVFDDRTDSRHKVADVTREVPF